MTTALIISTVLVISTVAGLPAVIDITPTIL